MPHTCPSLVSSVSGFAALCDHLALEVERWDLPTQHTEYNVAHILFKWSSCRCTSIRDGCLMTKTLCIPVLLSVLFLYVLPLPMLCFVYFPVLDLPHPLLIGHLISFMLSWFIVYSLSSNLPRLYTKRYRNCTKNILKCTIYIYQLQNTTMSNKKANYLFNL